MAQLIRPGRATVYALAAVYFTVPMLCSLAFSVGAGDSAPGVDARAYTGIAGAEGFTDSLWLTLGLALATVVLVLCLLVPALLTVRLVAPRLRPALTMLCLLPLVVPGVALGAGITTVLRWGADRLYGTPYFEPLAAIQDPDFPIVLLLAYALMALPLAFGTIDNGLAAIDLKVLVEAARSCRASWPRTLLSVVLPNLRTALLNAAFLTLALVLGEYTVAALLGYQPFAVWTVVISGSQARLAVAVCLVGLLGTWAMLLLVAATGRRLSRESR